MLVRDGTVLLTLTTVIASAMLAKPALADSDGYDDGHRHVDVQVGQRPLYLVDGMDDGPLKRKLKSCEAGPFRKSDFSLDVLARRVGILGIFSDWPATVTYYANCMNLK